MQHLPPSRTDAPLPKAHAPMPAGFRFPDEDQDSAEGYSREGSIQIIETRPHTYSVPSSSDYESDSGNDEIEMSSAQADSQRASAATTPDSKTLNVEAKKVENAEVNEEPRRGLNLRGPSLQDLLNKGPNSGSSHLNPIEIEELPPRATHVDDTEDEVSEDDGPEVLPISKREPAKTDDVGVPPRPQRPQLFLDDIQSANSPTFRHVVLETQTRAKASSINATDGYDSFSDNEDDDLDCFGDDLFQQVPRAINITGMPVNPRSSNLPGNVEVLPYTLSQSAGAIDVSRPQIPESSTHQRPPSPSDAALARTALNTNVPGKPSHRLRAHVQPHTRLLPRMQSFNIETGSAIPYHPDDWNVCHSNGNTDVAAEQDCRCEPLAETPFLHTSSHPDPAAASMSDRLPFGLADDSQRPHGLANEYTEGFFDDIADPLLECSESNLNSSPFGCHERYSVNASFNVPPAHTSNLQEPTLSRHRSTRPDISNLINDTYIGNQRRALKRKADEMSSNDQKPAQSTNAEASQRTSIPAPAVAETQLPDAQVREDFAMNISNANQILQDELNESLVNSIAIVEEIKTQEPPRKKAKTSSSSSKVGGIAKFVSGVCVGVVGVLAAIIATVPVSVQEEALREVTNIA